MRARHWRLLAVALTLAGHGLLPACATTGLGGTLAAIRQRGQLRCGVNGSLPGFSARARDGSFRGFDVDFCRALAAAVLGDDRKVSFLPLSTKDRFSALSRGEVDVLLRNTTWNLTRDTELGLDFGPPTFYDGQGFLVRERSKVANLLQLKGKRICVIRGTTSETNLRDALARMKIPFTPVPVASTGALAHSYHGGKCDVATSDRSALVAIIAGAPKPQEHLILGDTISKEPLGPAVRQGDPQWYDVVRWVVFATFEAEEAGVSKFNVDQLRKESVNGQQRRLLGVEGNLGAKLGLPRDWAYQVIKRVGNYAEIYQEHFGPRSRTPIPRWINKPWVEGGMHYAPPFR